MSGKDDDPLSALDPEVQRRIREFVEQRLAESTGPDGGHGQGGKTGDKPDANKEYIKETKLECPKIPGGVTFGSDVTEALGFKRTSSGQDMMYSVGNKRHVHPTAQTVTLADATTESSRRSFVVASHDIRRHVVAGVSHKRSGGPRTRSGDTPHLITRGGGDGLNPAPFALRGAAADLGLYPDFADGVDIREWDKMENRHAIASLYNNFKKYAHSAEFAATAEGKRVFTIFAYEDEADGTLYGKGYTLDVDRIHKSRNPRGDRKPAVRVTFPARGENAETLSTTVSMAKAVDSRTGKLHMYFGDGVAEAKSVDVVSLGDDGVDSFVQVIVFAGAQALYDLVSRGSVHEPAYMRTGSYLCCGDAKSMYRELGPYMGQAVYVSALGVMANGHMLTFNHEQSIVMDLDNSRVSDAVADLAADSEELAHMHAFQVHVAHNAQTHHVTMTVFLDDGFWMTALQDFAYNDRQITLSQPLAALFLLRRAGGRGVRIVDVSANGQGELARSLVQVAVHADSWAWLWLAAALRESRGTMAFVPESVPLHMDHDKHAELGTEPLSKILQGYVKKGGFTPGNQTSDTKVTTGRFRAASRVRMFTREVLHGAWSLGYLFFPRSPHWEECAVSGPALPRMEIEGRMRSTDFDDVGAVTFSILQNCTQKILESSDQLFRFCAAAHQELTRFFVANDPLFSGKRRAKQAVGSRPATERTYLVASSSVVVDAGLCKDLEDAARETRKKFTGEPYAWLDKFITQLAVHQRSDGGDADDATMSTWERVRSTVGLLDMLNGDQKSARAKRGPHRKRGGRAKRGGDKMGLLKSDGGSGGDGDDDGMLAGSDMRSAQKNMTVFVCPDCVEDMDVMFGGDARVKMINTGVFSMVVSNVLLHEMLLSRLYMPWTLVRLMRHVPDRYVLECVAGAMLAPENSGQYMPMWYVDDKGRSVKAFVPADHTERSRTGKMVWSSSAVPWWVLVEYALGFRVEARGIKTSLWNDKYQPADMGTPLGEAANIATAAIVKPDNKTERAESLRRAVQTGLSKLQEFTWGERPDTLMLTPMTVTPRQVGKSL